MTERASPSRARLPATAPTSSVPGAGQRSRNTVTNRPSSILSPRKAPRSQSARDKPSFHGEARRRTCEKSRPAPTKPRRTLSSLAPFVFAMRRNCTKKARGADHIDPLRAPVQLRLFKSSAVKDAITSRPSRHPSASAPRRRWCRRHWPSACRRTLRPVP